jgi:hypothetical protein
VGREECTRGANQPPLLRSRDRAQSIAELRVAASPNLDEDEAVTVLHHDVEFTEALPEVPLEQS